MHLRVSYCEVGDGLRIWQRARVQYPKAGMIYIVRSHTGLINMYCSFRMSYYRSDLGELCG